MVDDSDSPGATGIAAQHAPYPDTPRKVAPTDGSDKFNTLRDRSGSCRDFAVLMMEAVRSLGLAARFVSGYIFSPGQETVQGGGATHAWLQIYLPGAGWIDFDPTNSIIGNRHLIRVAVAWDHRQALPLWGTWYGTPDFFRGLEVEVNVTDGR